MKQILFKMKPNTDVVALVKDCLIPSPYYIDFDSMPEKEEVIMNSKDGKAYCLIKKLKNEFDALNNRINKLKAFMKTDTYDALVVDEKIDLNQQLEYMNGYANILNKRIERHTSKQTNNE